ncbi:MULTISPECIES: HoxN/HupN/NixA family nickel/cobalt transporter [Flavobacterium]|uniref:Nickel/cobalt efflux system n=1 Tax=Flavobacterium covae TaxID=2906076 RepID=A0ABW8PG58_9FLAO|nr:MULTISPECIES: NAD+ synthetase [Flavobacterium]OXA83115.1 NAD+ synthetase [Flavobacterium columnare] [Flavobacterium columnare NBRC 100251 = ATCC 23463]AMA48902.1 NAD+ synthetase [Flavobacterium covae]AND64966.1 NAD+ synthetase [Flavobacterium covae]MCJ1807179.1 NAD+ synthetase [Flavobacterium covae]MCJ1810085.1 NAD+ synthetase [Flavobacterium covae]
MELLNNNLSALLILFILGLRHGLDPDHITVIDNYTYRLHENKNTWSRWVGTLFTLGHGIMVTLIALILSYLKNNFQVPIWVDWVLNWLPMFLLLIIGIGNINSLIYSRKNNSLGLKKYLIPKFLDKKVSPITVFITGIIFGFIFDTSSQIAAFGLAISGTNHWLFSVIGGIVFSIGLIFTGTIDSYLLSKLLKTFDRTKIQKHRFKLNILITIMCFIIPIYKIATVFKPNMELSDLENNLIGLGFLGIILILYFDLYLRSKKQIK